MRAAAAIFTLLLPLLLSAAAGAQVKNWKYLGAEQRGSEQVIVAQASVSDDTLALIYSPTLKMYTLWFTYRGNVTFSKKLANKAEFFMRTRREPKLRGRYSSDYVFKGEVSVRPGRNPSVPQFVHAVLSPKDIKALRDYEKYEIIGVGYYISSGKWNTYTLPATGVWAAYKRIEAEAKSRGSKVAARPAKTTAKLQAAGKLLSASDAEKHFLHCSKLNARHQAATRRLEQSKRRAGPAMAELRRLRSKARKLEKEAEDAQLKAKIIQSNEDVQRSFRRAVRRYKAANARYREMNGYIKEQQGLYAANARERKRLDKRRRAECAGRWDGALVRRYCKSADQSHKGFCKEISFKNTN